MLRIVVSQFILYRAVGRSENPGLPVVIRWAQSVPLVEKGLTDLPKSGCAVAHPAHPGTTGLLYIIHFYEFVAGKQEHCVILMLESD